MPKTYIFYIDGMTCISCSGAIEYYLKSQLSDKLRSFNVDLTTPDPKKATIILDEEDDNHEKTWMQLNTYIKDIGFSCRDYNYSTAPIQNVPDPTTKKRTLLEKFKALAKYLPSSHWILGLLGCLSGILVLIACFIGGLPLALMITLGVCSTVLTIGLGAHSYYEAWTKLVKTGTLTMDSLFALSTLSILIVSLASFFVPWLPMMFDAALLIYGFRHIGIAIEDTIKEKIGTAKFQDRAPKKVRKQTAKGLEECNIADIAEEDIIIVQKGEIIPLDGYCEDESIIYNTIITGSPLPHHFPPNAKVLAGMRLADNASPLKIRVTKTQSTSYLARLDNAIERSALEKAPIEIKTGQLLTYFIPVVIALAIVSGIIISFFFPPAIAIQCAVSVLVSACPCTLGLITPLAVKTGMNKAAEHGVQFKSAKTLQQVEQLDTVVFDLNGTLTTGVPKINRLYVFDESMLSELEILSLCATLEKKSTHPIGKAIYSFAKQHVNKKQFEVTELDNSHHAGISGKINNEIYSIGSMTLMKDKGIKIPTGFELPILEAGDQLIFIAREDKVIGFMIMTDPLRKDALCTIKALKAMGKKINICTGADEETAHRYAQALGIDEVYANCFATSEDENQRSKVTYIHELRKQGRTVAMIGDAANDAQAIAASDLGIAVTSDGSDELTQQAAGIIIHTGTLLPIASAFAVSKQTVANINQNLILSLVYNFSSILISGGLLVAIGLTLNPVVGVVLMILQACIVLFNVYRFKNQPLEHLQESNLCEDKNHPQESSHAKINRYTPANTKELGDEQTLSEQSPSSNTEHVNNSTPYSFWSCFNSEANKQKEDLEQAPILR